MRIQHNIMAMGAYRNYTNNVNAMKKNLEKLSSGYKINRAGDDAAGLAISEKMRAQITGLETAQKNAKDGISLVQTAEGALTEVHDMLNRMVELANMSANGTYDSTTDRAQLQKELNQLNAEINRIADSANFNGIKLLDGSLDGSIGKEVVTEIPAETTTMDATFLPVKGNELSVNTVLHKETSTNNEGTTFSVDLHNTVFANNAGDDMTLKIGENEYTLTGDGTGALEGEKLVDKLVDTIKAGGDADGYVEFGGQKFKVEKGTSGDNRITFTQVAAPNNEASEVSGDMKVEITSTTNSIGSKAIQAGTPAEKAVYTIDLSNATGGDPTTGTTKATISDAANAANQSTIDGVDVTFEGNIDKTMQKFVEDYNALDGANAKDYTASWDGKVLTLTAKEAGVVATPPALTNFGDLTVNKEAVKDVQVLDLTGAGQAALAGKNVDNVTIDWDKDLDTTMKAFVEKYNKETSKAYTAEWADNKLTLTAKVAGALGSTGAPAAGGPTTDIAHTPATKEVKTFTITAAGTAVADNDVLVINGTEYSVKADGSGDITVADAADANKLAAFIKSKLVSNDYDITVEDNVITYTAKTAGAGAPAVGMTIANKTTAANVPTVATGGTAGADATNAVAGFTQVTAGDNAGVENMANVDFTEAVAGTDGNNDDIVVVGTADYNFKTTAITNVTANSGNRLASTYFDLTEEMVVDGGSLTIGKQTYTFSSDAADDGVEGKVYIGDLVDAEGKVDIAGNLDEIAQRVTDAAKDNTTWTVGHDKGGSTLSFVEKQDQKEYLENGKSSLTSVENIANTFSWTGAARTETTIVDAGGINGDGSGKALTLQIGDTAEEFNQLKVNIKDMHAASLGLDKISVADQESAAKAVDVIKEAINKVSDVRGTLGATQNRLDHTINNLSVMTENIQDAESTIRDTDVAAEMMEYTKNNILIQSAQAMLAQANQVPQGVLQLLQ